MKKILLLLIAVIIAATMTVTCPDKEAHMTALNNELSMLIDDKIDEANEKSHFLNDDDPLNSGFKMMASALAGGIVKSMVEQKLMVKNYFVCSLGQVNTDNGVKTLSVGLLGHVFTLIDAESLKESMK